MDHTKQLIRIAILNACSKHVRAWVDHYDAGEDDEKVIKVMLPMVAIAVLACVMGYYIKNKFFKDDEDKEEKEKNEQKKTADMRFPAPKANKPWLNNGQPVNKMPIGPTGGYEFTLPGYQQSLPNYKQATTGSTEKKAAPSSSRVQHVSEKKSSNYTRTKSHEKSRSLEKGSSRSQEKSGRSSEHRSRESRNTRPSGQPRSSNNRPSGQKRTERSSNPNYRSHQPRSNRPSNGHQR